LGDEGGFVVAVSVRVDPGENPGEHGTLSAQQASAHQRIDSFGERRVSAGVEEGQVTIPGRDCLPSQDRDAERRVAARVDPHRR